MEDFEKGLMLAGLISPKSFTEINERAELESYEQRLKKEKRELYFRRAVLAAEIAYQLHGDITFGRVKFQKMVYLCEHVADMNLEERYSKQAAGPFDNKFMHSIHVEFARQKWFEVEIVNDGKMNRSKYKPLLSIENYKSYYQKYFAQSNEDIQYVINLFRRSKTEDAEIAATLLACYLELKKEQIQISIPNLLEKFYKWSERKKNFDSKKVLDTWNWMIEKKLVAESCD